MIYRYGKRIQDPNMVSLAVGVPSDIDFKAGALRRTLPAIFNYEELAAMEMEPHISEMYGWMVSRSWQLVRRVDHLKGCTWQQGRT